MARNNTAKVKAKKTINKSQKQKKATKMSSSIHSMEKEFKNMPAKLIKRLRKDTAALKKQESTLNVSLKKTQKKRQLIADQQADLFAKAQERPNASIKKRLLAAQKKNDKINKNMTKLTSDLEKIQNQLSILSRKQAQFTYIGKEITQLDKKEITQLDKEVEVKPSKSTIKSRKKLNPDMDIHPLTPQDTTQPVQELIDSNLPETLEIES
jgi:hypothetical protein